MRAEALERHVDHRHLRAKRPYRCAAARCGHETRSLGALRSHEHIHSSADLFRCASCGFTTMPKAKAQVSMHLVLHAVPGADSVVARWKPKPLPTVHAGVGVGGGGGVGHGGGEGGGGGVEGDGRGGGGAGGGTSGGIGTGKVAPHASSGTPHQESPLRAYLLSTTTAGRADRLSPDAAALANDGEDRGGVAVQPRGNSTVPWLMHAVGNGTGKTKGKGKRTAALALAWLPWASEAPGADDGDDGGASGAGGGDGAEAHKPGKKARADGVSPGEGGGSGGAASDEDSGSGGGGSGAAAVKAKKGKAKLVDLLRHVPNLNLGQGTKRRHRKATPALNPPVFYRE